MPGRDLAREVTPARADRGRRGRRARGSSRSTPGSRRRSCATCASAACTLTLLPCTTRAGGGARRSEPDAVFLANGPGDPAALDYVVGNGARAGRQGAGVRHLPRPPAAVPGGRPRDVQAAVRPPRREPPGQGPRDRARSRSPRRTTASRWSAPAASTRSPGDEPVRWETDFGAAELSHVNLYDRTVEGLVLRDVPGRLRAVPPRGGPGPARLALSVRPVPGAGRVPKRTDIQRILIIGSGPIVIGQAAEFDYSGVQACKVLMEEGYEVVLVNSNPATIMTDPEFATATYIEPLTPETVAAVIERERPDALLGDARRPDRAEPRQGAARGRHARALRRRADRRRLRRDPARRGPRAVPRDDGRGRPARPALGDRAPRSRRPSGVIDDIGLPLIVRPAFTLGGHGGGIARTPRRVQRARLRGAQREPDQPGAAGAVAARLGRVRARGDARPQRQRARRVLDREHRPDGRAHRRQRHGRAAADAHGRRVPGAARPGAGGDPRGRRRDRRVQHPVRGRTRRTARWS